jgi:chromosome segregation ATPase
MSFDMEPEEYVERRLRRLEQRYRGTQSALAEARAVYASVHEALDATDLQRHQAQLRVQRAVRQLSDIQSAIELIEDQECDGRAPR